LNSEYPIYPKTYDLVRWLIERTQSFPKSQRFVMAKRVQDTALDFYELLIEARKVSRRQRRETLLHADVKLEMLRLHLRLCYELELLSSGQYQHVSKQVVEVGKLLGSWRQGLDS
jgi:four helix bundle protein